MDFIVARTTDTAVDSAHALRAVRAEDHHTPPDPTVVDHAADGYVVRASRCGAYSPHQPDR
jgi:hypothetical protein